MNFGTPAKLRGRFGKMDSFWQGKRVFITGHTGFKGSWLSLWLNQLGAQVTGYALTPPTRPSLFCSTRLIEEINSIEGDILDYEQLKKKLLENRPDVIFHLAAQSLVRQSYLEPRNTLAVNILGTANLLDAARYVDRVHSIVNITSDKCYENREWVWGYRENDPMGGHDPYSCSKGCAELVTSSYRRSFFSTVDTANIASARAGNVIGGGDWAHDRIIPDSIRAIMNGLPINIRNPQAIRPWQHVLEPLAGYLLLAQKLWESGDCYAGGWNFGPDASHCWSVNDLVNTLCNIWGEPAKWDNVSNTSGDLMHEASYLKLDSAKATTQLGWRPILKMDDTLAMTVNWYKRYNEGEDAKNLTCEQIIKYQKLCEVIVHEK